MLCPSPAMYGGQVAVVLPSGIDTEFGVGGNYRTSPTLRSTSSGGQRTWQLTFDGTTVLRIESESAISRVDIDCGSRACKVNGVSSLPTLSSDWPVLSAGQHRVRNEAGVDVVMTFMERWL